MAINSKLTSDLGCIRKFLPVTKSGKAIRMMTLGINSKVENIFDQWYFPNSNPNEMEIREIAGRLAEVSLKIIFLNFSYSFGEKVYKQKSGGPIGARVSMSAGRLVIQQWGDSYRRSLEITKMELRLLVGYVDDIRQGGSQIRYGMRFSIVKMEWKWSASARLDNIKLKEEGEDPNDIKRCICLPAMNAQNDELEFTAEICKDFEAGLLPTLDSELWINQLGLLKHNYFQNKMKTLYVVMKRWAMAQPQKISILVNEMIRRLSNTDYQEKDMEEKKVVMNQYTRELKQSGYTRKEVKEIVCCGMLGWKKKM